MDTKRLNKNADLLVTQALEILSISFGISAAVIEACLTEDSDLMESFNAIVDLGIYNLRKEEM